MSVDTTARAAAPQMDPPQQLRAFWNMARRRRGAIWVAVLAVSALGLALAIFWPPMYRSDATILIEEQEIPTDLVRSTVTSYADQRIETIKQQVLSRSSLWRIVEAEGLYASLRKRKTTEEVLEQFNKDIRVHVINVKVVDKRSQTPTQATIAFTLAYDGESPASAQRVANELVSLFLRENLKTRERRAQETTIFLRQAAERLGAHLEVVEAKIATLKQQAEGALPELTQLNMQMLNQAERELLDVDRDIRSLGERKTYLEGELGTLKPHTPIIAAGGERILDTWERLKALRAQLASARGYFAESHPDIIRMQQEVASLEQDAGGTGAGDEVSKQLEGARAHASSLRERLTESHPDVVQARARVVSLEAELKRVVSASTTPTFKPENPAYIAIQAQLASVTASLEALRRTKVAVKQRVADLAKRIERLPEVEPQYVDLLRERENTARKHQEIASRLMEAQVSEGLEVQRKGERFSLIDPPDYPERPESPNRPVILVLSGLIAVAAGIGTGTAAERLDGTVRSAGQVARIVGIAPLASIPYLPTQAELTRGRRRRWGGRLLVITLLAAMALAAHVMWLPLDVLWFTVLRKLGAM